MTGFSPFGSTRHEMHDVLLSVLLDNETGFNVMPATLTSLSRVCAHGKLFASSLPLHSGLRPPDARMV